MIHYWQLPEDSTPYLEPYRTLPELRIAIDDSILWLQFPNSLLLQSPSLNSLPALKRFYSLVDQPYLFSSNSALPQETLPGGPWESLQSFLQLHLPTPALPASIDSLPRLTLSLFAAPDNATPIAASLLLIPTSTWIDYALEAPEYRLSPLQIACNLQAETLVIGTPLPSLPGVRFYELDRIFLPLGLTWFPPIPFITLKQILDLLPHERIVWFPDNHLAKVTDEQWVPASRAGAAAMKKDK